MTLCGVNSSISNPIEWRGASTLAVLEEDEDEVEDKDDPSIKFKVEAFFFLSKGPQISNNKICLLLFVGGGGG